MRSRGMKAAWDRASLGQKIAAFAGLAFLHLPVWVIFLYAFTTEDRTYQFPPPGLQLSVVLPPAQILYMPVMAPGGGFTVTVILVVQPLADV